MTRDRDLQRVIEETAAYAGKRAVTPEQHQQLKRAVFGDAFDDLAASGRSYFVLGSYDDGEKRRLILVRDALAGRGPDTHAFLMDDFPEAWEYWTTKFKILASRADYVVGVFEHSRGGHAWESGYIDHERFRQKSHVLKREYETEAAEREAFDAMFAHFLAVMDGFGRVYRWSDDAELREQVGRIP